MFLGLAVLGEDKQMDRQRNYKNTKMSDIQTSSDKWKQKRVSYPLTFYDWMLSQVEKWNCTLYSGKSVYSIYSNHIYLPHLTVGWHMVMVVGFGCSSCKNTATVATWISKETQYLEVLFNFENQTFILHMYRKVLRKGWVLAVTRGSIPPKSSVCCMSFTPHHTRCPVRKRCRQMPEWSDGADCNKRGRERK